MTGDELRVKLPKVYIMLILQPNYDSKGCVDVARYRNERQRWIGADLLKVISGRHTSHEYTLPIHNHCSVVVETHHGVVLKVVLPRASSAFVDSTST